MKIHTKSNFNDIPKLLFLDPLADVKDAHAAGRKIEARQYPPESHAWHVVTLPNFEHPHLEWRIAPWTLPEPPSGQQWHRTDWTEDKLPEGWRPLLATEGHEPEDQWINNDGTIGTCTMKGRGPAKGYPQHYRTRRPLPTTSRMVPLEASDVPPGSAFRGPNDPIGIWVMALSCTPHGMMFPEYRLVGFSHMTSGWLILRPGDTEWRPCQKEAK